MEISNSIRYIGVDDLDIDLFESQYVVPEGVSYNSYVILDDKIAVMDTADARKGEAWKQRLEECLAGRQPDYLVCHHMEPDHASLVGEMMNIYPDMQLVLSAAAEIFASDTHSSDTAFNKMVMDLMENGREFKGGGLSP